MVDAGCEVIIGDADQGRDEIQAVAGHADAFMGATFHHGVMDRAFLESFPALRIVAKYTIGFDDVDLEAATQLGILVTHCPTEANWGGVAEGTLALMLGFLKKLRERDFAVKQGGWRDPQLQGTYLGQREDGYPGITVGIVGFGRIGRRVAELLAPWRVRLLACDPYIDTQLFAQYGAENTDLDTLLCQSDVVTLHCTLTPETRQLINTETLARMKETALLINTARGAVVDLNALCEAIETQYLAGAALDVLDEEPPPERARVLCLGDQVMLCPHMIAANRGGTLSAAIPWATEATLAALRGDLPMRICNAEVIPKWQQRFADRSLL